MKIGIIGSGVVGTTLAVGLSEAGNEIRLGTGSSDKIKELTADGEHHYTVGLFPTVAEWAEAAVLCVKGSAAEKLVSDLATELADKPVIDTTNPISDKPPTNGVLEYFTGQNESLMERLQAIAPKTQFVKAFNSVGSGVMVQPKFSTTPTMFICGDEVAKPIITPLIESLGWVVEDLGASEAARPIEDLCKLWCITGFRDNDWNHSLKYLRPTSK